MVLKRQSDGTFKPDWIYLALVVKYVRCSGVVTGEFREDGVKRWGSTDKRVKSEDFWVNYVR